MTVTLNEAAEQFASERDKRRAILRRIAAKIVANRTPEEKRAAAKRAIEKAEANLVVANESLAELDEEYEEYDKEAYARELERGMPEGVTITLD